MFKILAGILAVGGLCWGGIIFVFVAELAPLLSPWAYAIMLPGYIVTAGYVCGACRTPDVSLRRIIWGFSLAVQGGWLVFFLWGVKLNGSPQQCWRWRGGGLLLGFHYSEYSQMWRSRAEKGRVERWHGRVGFGIISCRGFPLLCLSGHPAQSKMLPCVWQSGLRLRGKGQVREGHCRLHRGHSVEPEIRESLLRTSMCL